MWLGQSLQSGVQESEKEQAGSRKMLAGVHNESVTQVAYNLGYYVNILFDEIHYI